MYLKKSFQALLDNKINLNETRRKSIISAHKSVRDYLESHEKIKKYFIDSYLQGSYAQNTAIKPSNGNDYDVDIVFTFDWKNKNGDFKDTTTLKNLIYDALDESPVYGPKLLPHRGKKCITLEFNGFHLDALPAHDDDDGTDVIWIINKYGDWRESNPKGFANWCIEINKESDNYFKRTVRIVKYWRNIQFGENSAIKSIILSTILGNNFSYSNLSLDRSLVETFENISKKYKETDTEVPEIFNPSLETENLARHWELDDYQRFCKAIRLAAETGRKALDLKTDIQKAIDLWNSAELFYGNLPNDSLDDDKLLKESEDINKFQQSNNLYITNQGYLSEKKAGAKIVVPPARSWRC